MDRKIAFRAWHPEKGWADEVTVYGDGSWSATFGNVEGYDEDDGMHLVQFTGYKDKHGEEIFESDIVKADWCWIEPHAIVWPHDQYDFIEFGLDTANVEIIGNIYENSDLLPDYSKIDEI
jgi:hypothetical protein